MVFAETKPIEEILCVARDFKRTFVPGCKG